jgi:hypothetical protein
VDALRTELVEDGAVRALLQLLDPARYPDDPPAFPALLPPPANAPRASEARAPAPAAPAQPVLEVSAHCPAPAEWSNARAPFEMVKCKGSIKNGQM